MKRKIKDKYVSKFLNFLQYERYYSLHTINSYKLDIYQFAKISYDIDLSYEEVAWHKLGHAIIKSYLHSIDELVSPQSQARKLSVMRTFFTFLQREQLIINNFFESYRGRKQLKTVASYLTIREVNILLETPSHFWLAQHSSKIAVKSCSFVIFRDTALLEIIYSAGLRISEALNLDWQEFGDFIQINGKGKKQRLVFIGEPARVALQNYRNFLKEFNQNLQNDGNSLFINQRNFCRLTSRSFQRFFKKYLSFANLSTDYTPHSLRHSFATHLLDNGADIRSVQKLLGHENLSTTEIYTHISPKQLFDAYKKAHPHR